ncbi:M23 family metallopeptidase [Winogradskyella sp.]|uniref:peptidoglycan DD-metalloendopeptidase family protein n=1 Tax=Winogradskyella sp. TaxID=1883156 RepID=UPI001B276791|nr:M23 family metallopeptidase [Winogradskyella sp.]MBO6879445.1 peptidoglycan DD-metalloendopeptidase family protein [Winogradskyella sp.]
MNKIIYLFSLLGIFTSCSDDNSGGNVSSALQKSPVNIGETYNTTTNLIGNVNMFIGFGQTIDVGLPTEHISPAFEYITNIDTEVRSTSHGTISSINYQEESEDYELHIILKENSAYLIIYDHVKNLEVEQGDIISSGDILGVVGNWSDTLGRTELQINLGNKHICPIQLGNDVFIEDHSRLVSTLNQNEITMLTSACLVDEIDE